MKIILRPHLKIRLKQRLIPDHYPKLILADPENQFLDGITGHRIAIKKLEYNNKLRPMVTVYDIINEETQVITIYPTTNKDISNRLESKRWIKQ